MELKKSKKGRKVDKIKFIITKNIEEEARHRVEKKNEKSIDDLTFKVLMRFKIQDSLAAQAGALSFEQWKKHLSPTQSHCQD